MKFDGIRKLWNYIQERERIRIRKERGDEWPWTENNILKTYKFTNVKRSNDRTTKEFVEIYEKHKDEERNIALFNCGIARYFGRCAMLSDEGAGWQRTFDKNKLQDSAVRLISNGTNIFTGAYVITNSGRSEPKYSVVIDYLSNLWQVAEDVTKIIKDTDTWEAGYQILRRIDGFGGTGFMAKEVLQDYLLWLLPLTPSDNATFTPVGPGARRGLNRISYRDLNYRASEAKFLSEILEIREFINPLWTKEFEDTLTAHDIQFTLCEWDKFERVRLDQGRPRSRYAPHLHSK